MQTHQSVYGIIGYPVEHSLSPLMHNAAFKALGVDAVYNFFPLKEEELDKFFGDLRKVSSPIFGLNVTVPYKERAMQYMDSLAPLAQKIGAINTIVISRDRKLIGYNTDAPGFLTHLAGLGFKTAGKKIAILGAGGSARAVLTTLCMIPERPASIKIYNRTTARADELLAELSSRIDMSIVELVMSIDDLNIDHADLLINTTSVGMNRNDPPLIDAGLLRPRMLVYDLIYNPPETKLLQLAKQRGARTANGLEMLFYQGVLALQHWANIELEDDIKKIMREALEKGLAKGTK